MKNLVLVLSILLFAGCSAVKNIKNTIDIEYKPVVKNPAYIKGTGLRVYIDEGHNNYHTMNGLYKPFADLLKTDGYRVNSISKSFNKENLGKVDVLVIVNAIHIKNIHSWSLPIFSAFTNEEISELNQWVKNGGALWLIVDHMPLSGASQKLAASFGFILNNGHAHGPDNNRHIRFSRENRTLKSNPITNGINLDEKIHSVYTYSGDAFKIPVEAISLLKFQKGSYSLNPQVAFKFSDETERVDISDWSHAALRKYGDGKVVLLGESGGFTAQVLGEKRQKVGLNSPNAPDNHQFILNIAHWISGLIE